MLDEQTSRSKNHLGCSHFVLLFSSHYRPIWFGKVIIEFYYLYQNCFFFWLHLILSYIRFNLNTVNLSSVSGQHSPSSSYCPGDLPCHVNIIVISPFQLCRLCQLTYPDWMSVRENCFCLNLGQCTLSGWKHSLLDWGISVQRCHLTIIEVPNMNIRRSRT